MVRGNIGLMIIVSSCPPRPVGRLLLGILWRLHSPNACMHGWVVKTPQDSEQETPHKDAEDRMILIIISPIYAREPSIISSRRVCPGPASNATLQSKPPRQQLYARLDVALKPNEFFYPENQNCGRTEGERAVLTSCVLSRGSELRCNYVAEDYTRSRDISAAMD